MFGDSENGFWCYNNSAIEVSSRWFIELVKEFQVWGRYILLHLAFLAKELWSTNPIYQKISEMKLLPWKSWKDTVGEKQKCWKQDDRWINTNSEQKRCCTSPKRKHSAVLVKSQHTIFSCAKRQHLWTTNGWRNVNPYFGSPPCCLNMTLSVTKKEPEIKKWNEGTLSREKVTWWKKKCQSLFSFSSSPLLRGSTSCRCQVPTLSQTQAHHSMFNVRCDMCNVG